MKEVIFEFVKKKKKKKKEFQLVDKMLSNSSLTCPKSGKIR
jgi:hypothetical protein